jgi:hypothetical protein
MQFAVQYKQRVRAVGLRQTFYQSTSQYMRHEPVHRLWT